MELLIGLLVGVGMGVLIQRVRASSPAMIAANLRLENLTIIKFMALTIAVGTVGTYLLAPFLAMHFAVKPLYLGGVLLGGLIFGIGFGLAGYCPGTCVVGAAEGRKDALATIAGGIVGALAFTFAYPSLQVLFEKLNFGKVTLADLAHLPPLAMAVMLAGALLLVIAIVPTRPRR